MLGLQGAALAAAALSPGAAMAAGMPQLDFANPLTTSQVVWAVLIFALLYILLAYWALPEVGRVLDHRAAAIDTDLDTARVAKATADTAVAEMTDATGRARAESQNAISAAVDRAKQAAGAEAAELDARLEAELKAAEARIADARRAALGALREAAADTATNLLARLIGRQPDQAQVATAVDAALAERALAGRAAR